MKKRLLLISSLTCMVVTGALAAGLSLKHSNKEVETVQATSKSFTFDASVGTAQFYNKFADKKPAEISVDTNGISSNLETSVRLRSGETSDYDKFFGHNGRFVESSETFTGSYFEVEIGANNITSVQIVYGCIKTTYTNVTNTYCYIYDSNDKSYALSGSNGDVFNEDCTLNWTKTSGDVIRSIYIKTGASGGSNNIFWGEPVYIKSITVTWDC